MNDREFVAFDLETTGLSPSFCQVVEIGAVRFRADGTEIDRMQRLVDPCCPIPPGAMAVHGITDELVSGQPRIEHVLPEFLEFIGNSETVLIAHNASFDLGFLSAAATRARVGLPKHPVLDTLALCRKRLRRLRNHRLDTVSRHFRVTDFTEHRALGDALATKEVFLRLLKQPPAIRNFAEITRLAPPLRFEPASLEPPPVPKGFEPLHEAIQAGQPLAIAYQGGSRGGGRRWITPRGLIESKGKLYLIAQCHIDGMDKHFRLDRIREVEGYRSGAYRTANDL